MADPIMPWAEPHDEAEALLPWYATGKLDDGDRARVEQHLAGCAECRQQLGVERRLMREFRAFTPEVESGWARLRSRVAAPGLAAATPRRRSFSDAAGDLWAAFTRPVILAFAAAQVAFVALASGLVMWLSQPAYQALGSAPAPAAANAIVMFRADATVEDVRSAMTSAGASIVSGPTSTGAYLLHVDPRQRQAALAKLRSDDEVQLAEQIDAAGNS
jgi:anti-sigma factor RsiW